MACADGLSNKEAAAKVGVEPHTVSRWRRRFVERRLEGLADEPRVGRPPSICLDQVEQVLVDTLKSKPANATHWSRASMAERSGLSTSTIGRIWKDFELKPHLTDGFKISTDSQFVAKVVDLLACFSNPAPGLLDLYRKVRDLARQSDGDGVLA